MASNAEGEQTKRQRLRTPKAKPFLFDNSANENAIDWTLDQLSERTSFVPRLYALPLFASWTSRPPWCYGASLAPPRRVRASCRSTVLLLCHSCCRTCAPWRYDAAPAAAPVHGADLVLSTVLRLHPCPHSTMALDVVVPSVAPWPPPQRRNGLSPEPRIRSIPTTASP